MIAFLRRKAALLGLAAVVITLLSACGANSNSSGLYGSGSATGRPSVAPSVAPSTGPSQVGTRQIAGIGTVLVNSEGLTLYHLTTDTSTKTTCIGGCAQVWPPLLATAGSPRPSSGAIGTFATLSRPDGGEQVTFNGMPLYTFAGDSQPGQANGQGIDGFFAVTS